MSKIEHDHPDVAPGGYRVQLTDAALIVEPLEPLTCDECEDPAEYTVFVCMLADYGMRSHEGCYCADCVPEAGAAGGQAKP